MTQKHPYVGFLLLLVVFTSARWTVAADPVPTVTAALSTRGDIWQGQRVLITVTIRTPDTFASPPAFDLPRISGALLVPPSGRPVLGSETVDDVSFTTQVHELALFPQQAGTITVPPFPIRFDSSQGFGKPVEARVVTTPAISIPVKRPPGTESLALVLTTGQLTVSDSWKPDPKDGPVETGAALTRTIQISAKDLPGMVLPSLTQSPPTGLRLYSKPPDLSDQESRGDLVGHKTETVTYVCESPGLYDLPALSVTWWDSQQQQLHRAILPARTITVTAPVSPNVPVEPPPVADTATSVRRSVLMIGFALLAVAGVRWMIPTLRRYWQSCQRAVAESEGYAYRALLRACRTGQARQVSLAYHAWRRRLQVPAAANTNANECEARLAKAVAELDQAVYGKPVAPAVSWSAGSLLAALPAYRRYCQRARRRCHRDRPLPSLNPN